MIKKCIICGADFKCPPSAKKVTCSPVCRSERARRVASHKRPEAVRQKISQSAKGRDMSAIQGKGTTAAQKSPKGGRFETNSSAKEYILISPDGDKIIVVNLRNWARANSHLFDVDTEPTDENVDRICHGFYKILSNTIQNKPGQSYKGWTIEAPDRRKNCEKMKKEQ